MHFKVLLILTNYVMLIASGCDTTRSLGIWFRSFVDRTHDTKYHECCIMFMVLVSCTFWGVI